MKFIRVRSWIPALTALLLCAVCAQKNLSAHETEASVLARERDMTREVEWAIPPRFDYAYDFGANGLARVEVKGKWGYIRAPLPWR
jgi:hypothetical protein